MRQAGILLAAALLLAGCGVSERRGEQAIAAGSWRSIAAASRVARSCGVRDTRADPLDRSRVVLMLGQKHSDQAEACLRGWLRGNAGRFDAALLATVTTS